ncbi:MAG: L,D-transpeptidase family protein [Syntrophomonadaceae bacterium]|nr:L,D-transpeptidase family protein [Syntrophomonadaceae bacterium]
MVYASRFLRVTSPFMSGPDVSQVQQQLRELGIYQGEVDGVYTPAVEVAVREFQQRNGLDVDGIVGPNTYQALFPGYKGSWGPLQLTVDVDNRTLQVRRENKVIKTYPVAVGKPETPTPLGDWSIVEKTVNPGGPFGARWMRLSVPWGGYGIHGTNNPNSIGKAASHGCVRMFNEDVIELYDMVTIGTPVKITGTAYTGRILKLGAEGNDVGDIQQKLKVLGYYTGDVDGVYGTLTEQAVSAFQKDQGLDPDGIVGVLTYNALQKIWDIIQGDIQP